MSFDQKAEGFSGEELKSPRSRYILSRQKELILDLVAPQAGERILDIGCGTGNHLKFFDGKKCSLTGLDFSGVKPEISPKKYGGRVELISGQAQDIPFSDDEFDIVTIINFLEIADDPRRVVEEAIRVCRGRVFIGFLNNYSLAGSRQRLKEIFGFPLSQEMRFFSFPEIRNMVKSLAGDTVIKWGSVIYFPRFVYDIFEEPEEVFPFRNNPFGAFIGLTFPVKYIYRTAQSPIMNSFKLKTEAPGTAPEVVRDMLRHTCK
ncbi:MAG TPA: methyltransferase domain-containing protein [Smithella sp.]|nr:methyltransferase domain-containing protein [Smithella sp.]